MRFKWLGGNDKKKNVQVRLSLSGVVTQEAGAGEERSRRVLNRKLLILDVALAAAAVYAGLQFSRPVAGD